MAPFASKYATPYHCLGIGPAATLEEDRTAYKTLAVQLHPDKASASQRASATAEFQELYRAYEICLSKLDITNKTTTVEDGWEQEEDESDTNNFRGGEGSFWGAEDVELPEDADLAGGASWWDGNPPKEWVRWARVQAKAQRNAGKKQTDVERMWLNMEYMAAYEAFEAWRLAQEARASGQEAAPDLDDNSFFQSDDGDVSQPPRRLNGMRLDRNLRFGDSLTQNGRRNAAITASKRLEMARKQLKACEERDERLQRAGEADMDVNQQKKQRRRKEKLDVLEAEAKLEADQTQARKDAKARKQLAGYVEAAQRKGVEFDPRKLKGVETPALFDDVPPSKKALSDGTNRPKRALKDTPEIPESWEDGCSDEG